MKFQSEFSLEFLKNNFRQFAAPSKCRPVRPAPPAAPRYASGHLLFFTNKEISSLMLHL